MSAAAIAVELPVLELPVLEQLGARVDGLYVLHLEPPYLHAGHYLGWTDDVRRRVAEHLACGSKSSPLVRAAIDAGSAITLAAIWPGASRTEERRRKRCGHVGSRYCPVCRSSSSRCGLPP